MAARADWRRYVAPAAFLLVATVAVILIRSALEAGGDAGSRSSAQPPPPVRHVVATTTTTASRAKHHAARRFWIVQAGDTFGVISSKTGVPVATIEQLNPQISSTSLFIGEKIRIR